MASDQGDRGRSVEAVGDGDGAEVVVVVDDVEGEGDDEERRGE